VSYHPLIILGASIAALSIAPAANAQASTPAAKTSPTASGPKPIARAAIVQELNANYKNVDTNGDGVVTTAEIAAAQTRAQQSMSARYAKRLDQTFSNLDTNKDGQLSPAEFKAGSPMPQRPQPDPVRLLGEMDANKDLKITLAEFGAPTLANFDRIDTNHDGVVTPDEAQKARAPARK